MKRSLIILAAGFAAFAVAAPAGAHGTISITIRHQTVGCHAWAIGSGPFAASHTLRVDMGTMLTFKNNDVMPHTLVQLGGPAVKLRQARMAKMAARTTIFLGMPGRYVFGTKAGEDYYAGVKTKGADNVLKLVVIVK